MADQLASPQDLATLLNETADDRMTLLVECGTAVVQNAADGQRIVRVEDDTFEVPGGSSQWVGLPQWPVESVSSVQYNGSLLSTPAGYRLRGSHLWCRDGWSSCRTDLNVVSGVYTHGYADGAQELQFARQAVLGLIRDVYDNPTGLRQQSLDDWSATYAALASHMDGSPALRAAIYRQYGRRP